MIWSAVLMISTLTCNSMLVVAMTDIYGNSNLLLAIVELYTKQFKLN